MRSGLLLVGCLALASVTGCYMSGRASTSTRSGTAQEQAKEQREVTGRIASHTTAPRGEMDGFVLDTGNRVHFPIHTGSTLRPYLEKGQEVRVIGTLVDRPEGKVLEAISITNVGKDKTLEIASIQPPATPAPAEPTRGVAPPGRATSTTTLTGAELTSKEGKVKGYTTAGTGDMDGVLLDTGVRVHFPPQAGKPLLPHVQQGKSIRVVGWEVTGPEGTILEATRITAIPGGQSVDIAEVAAPPAPQVTPGAASPPGAAPLEQQQQQQQQQQQHEKKTTAPPTKAPPAERVR